MKRRHWLQAVTLSGLGWCVPTLLAADKVTPGLRRSEGAVSINGLPAKAGQVLQSGDVLRTGEKSSTVAVVGSDAFLLRENSTVHFEGQGSASDAVRLASGGMLAVFGKRQQQELTVKTPTLTAGIRGTGCYLEASARRTYVCLCYGLADFIPTAAPHLHRQVETRHHEHPYWISLDPEKPWEEAPMLNHTDEELILLESLQTREPPFLGQSGLNGYPQRPY